MDTESLLRSLNEHSVRFVVIGATAFPVHGYARATLDIDIFIEPSEENARRTHAALTSFGYDLSDVSVHPFVAGVTFEAVWRGRVEDKIGTTPVAVAGLDDLIKTKEAAGRAKDLEDLRVLRRLKEKQRG